MAVYLDRGRRALLARLVLDHGADHYLLEVSAQDLKVILQLMKRSSTTLFDRDSLALTSV